MFALFFLQVLDMSGAAPPLATGGVLTGQDVISEGLITFASIQELVSINTKLQVMLLPYFFCSWC